MKHSIKNRITKNQLLQSAQAVRSHLQSTGEPAFIEHLLLIQQLYRDAYPSLSDIPDRIRWDITDMQPGEKFTFPIVRLASAHQAVQRAQNRTGNTYRVQRINARTGVILCLSTPHATRPADTDFDLEEFNRDPE